MPSMPMPTLLASGGGHEVSLGVTLVFALACGPPIRGDLGPNPTTRQESE